MQRKEENTKYYKMSIKADWFSSFLTAFSFLFGDHCIHFEEELNEQKEY